MKKIILILSVVCVAAIIIFFSCNDQSHKGNTPSAKAKHHLNIPESGIQSMMEANTQKVIEGTDGSIIILVGEITRKKVDITIKRDDKILDERIIAEHDRMTFDYEGNTYSIDLHNIKKPLIGEGKAEISIR
ncbi:hypothetical protein EMGBS15_15480 [Filimonas sp.]|jgi:hypothetical protein|nr:hypothetical protein EMGBS15_15480 [Filimonas sp.]